MKKLITILLLTISNYSFAGQVNSATDTWNYLISKNKKYQWAVVSLSRDQYIQCTNEIDYIRCPFPVSVNFTRKPKQFKMIKPRPKPYPIAPNSKQINYLTGTEVNKIKNTLKELNLESFDVYSKIVDENEKAVGSSYDIVLILELDYKHFNLLVNKLFKNVWGASKQQKYFYETDS